MCQLRIKFSKIALSFQNSVVQKLLHIQHWEMSCDRERSLILVCKNCFAHTYIDDSGIYKIDWVYYAGIILRIIGYKLKIFGKIILE